MNFLTPIIPRELREQIVAELKILAAKHAGSSLGIALSNLSVFIKNYASKTPAKLLLIYALTSFEQETVTLVRNAYLAILELRGFKTKNISKSQIEYIDKIALKMLHKIPSVMADYKAFCKKHAKDYTEIGAKPRLDSQLMDAYFKQFEANIKTNTDPLVNEVIRILAIHRLLAPMGKSYDFDNIRFLFLLILLKLHATVDIGAFFDSILSKKPDLGQFSDGILQLVSSTWPSVLTDIVKAIAPIIKNGYNLMLAGDASVLKDAVDAFEKFDIDTREHIRNCFNINQEPPMDPEKIATILTGILDITDPAFKTYLMGILQENILSRLSNYKATNQNEAIGSFLSALPRYAQARHLQDVLVMTNNLGGCFKSSEPLTFNDATASVNTSMPMRKFSSREIFNMALTMGGSQ